VKKAVIVCIAMALVIPWTVPIFADEETDNSGVSSARCPALGAAQELCLLVLGIGWEAVRIVLPDSYPAKDKDIDGLLGEIPSDRSVTP
jgi:hypothetical protein